MSCQSIEALLYRWGEWRIRELSSSRRSSSHMYTPGATETTKRYWQPCMGCLHTGVDPDNPEGVKVGSGIVKRSDYEELRKHFPCPVCRGQGGAYTRVATADPAAIPRTGPGGMHVPGEEVPRDLQELEHAMQWNLSWVNRLVLMARYVVYPRENPSSSIANGRRARVAWVNAHITPDRISDQSYGQRLNRAKHTLSREIGLPMKKYLYQEESE